MYKIKDSITRAVIIGLLSFFLIVSMIQWWFPYSDVRYIYFTSPDKEETFVIEETRYSEVYQISESGILTFHLANISGDDGLRMFSENMYKLEWKKPNTLKIYYVHDYMKPNQYEEISVQYRNY